MRDQEHQIRSPGRIHLPHRSPGKINELHRSRRTSRPQSSPRHCLPWLDVQHKRISFCRSFLTNPRVLVKLSKQEVRIAAAAGGHLEQWWVVIEVILIGFIDVKGMLMIFLPRFHRDRCSQANCMACFRSQSRSSWRGCASRQYQRRLALALFAEVSRILRWFLPCTADLWCRLCGRSKCQLAFLGCWTREPHLH